MIVRSACGTKRSGLSSSARAGAAIAMAADNAHAKRWNLCTAAPNSDINPNKIAPQAAGARVPPLIHDLPSVNVCRDLSILPAHRRHGLRGHLGWRRPMAEMGSI